MLHGVFSFFYPAYMSYKSLTNEARDGNQIKKWLCYWTILATWHVFDDLIANTLGLLPYFSVIQLVFLISLYNHKSNGALLVYENVAAPLMKMAKPYVEVPVKELEGLLNLTS